MNITDVLTQIDAEISRLRQARTILAGRSKHGGRDTEAAGKRHTMSAAGRARIAAAQRARWAKLRKAKSS